MTYSNRNTSSSLKGGKVYKYRKRERDGREGQKVKLRKKRETSGSERKKGDSRQYTSTSTRTCMCVV